MAAETDSKEMIIIRYIGRRFQYSFETEKWTRLDGDSDFSDFVLDTITPGPHQFMVDAIKDRLRDDVEILHSDPENLEDVRDPED